MYKILIKTWGCKCGFHTDKEIELCPACLRKGIESVLELETDDKKKATVYIPTDAEIDVMKKEVVSPEGVSSQVFLTDEEKKQLKQDCAAKLIKFREMEDKE